MPSPGTARIVRNLPPVAQSTAPKLALVGFREGQWQFQPNAPIPDLSHRVQVRGIAEPAKPGKVAHYADMMRPYTLRRDQLIMPPVILTSDGYVVDGNTRLQAAIKLGWHTYPAFVLDISYDGAPEVDLDRLLTLGGLLNLSHGEGMNSAQVENLILRLIHDDGDSVMEISRKLQVSRPTVQGIMNARKTRERARALGIVIPEVGSPGCKLTRSHLADLGAKIDRFKNGTFSAMLELIIKTELPGTEERSIMKRVIEAPTEEDGLKIIAAEMASRSGMAAKVSRRPSKAAQVRQSAGLVVNHFREGTLGLLVETEPESEADQLKMLEDAVNGFVQLRLLQLARKEKMQENAQR
jgi:hypothetical protein